MLSGLMWRDLGISEQADPHPERHQVSELPRVWAEVTEHRRHALRCGACAMLTRADWPAGAPRGAVGPRAQAVVGYLTGRLGASHRDVVEAMSVLYGLTLLSTDGTRTGFTLINGEHRCYEVRDRNGNYVSVAYYGDGRISAVTDTLGRVVTFNYDQFQNLLSITQPWKRETEQNPSGVDKTHVWATFGYANLTLQPSFSDLAVMGEQPGTVIPVVDQVGLSDDSYYKFSYNQWGQVKWLCFKNCFSAIILPSLSSHVRLI